MAKAEPAAVDGSAVSIGDVGGNISHSLIAGRDLILTVVDNVTGRTDSKIRANLLRRVDERWVKSFLQARLFSSEPFAVPAQMELRDRPGPKSVPSGTEELTPLEYQDALILGAPGAGKTIFLLLLLQKALQAARGDPTAAAPVMLLATSWKNSDRGLGTSAAFEKWLIEQVQIEYKVSGRTIQSWLEDGSLSLFIDGIDEIESQAKLCFLHALRDFQRNHDLSVYATCRQEDYYQLQAAAGGKALLAPDLVVALQMLETDDVEFLISERRADLIPVMRGNLEIIDLCRSPLVLSLVLEMEAGLVGDVVVEPIFSALFRHRVNTRGIRIKEHRLLAGLASVGRLLVKGNRSSFHFSDLNVDALGRFVHLVFGAVAFTAILVLTNVALTALGVERLGTRSWFTFWITALIGAFLFGIKSGGLHQGLLFDGRRGLLGAAIGFALCLAFAIAQALIAVVDVAALALLYFSQWVFLGALALLVVATAIWAFVTGESVIGRLGSLFGWIIGLHVFTFIPLEVFGWIFSDAGEDVGERVSSGIWNSGIVLSAGYVELALVNLKWPAWLWLRAMGALSLSLVILCFLIAMWRFRPTDRFSDWARTLGAMSSTAVICAIVVAALFAAAIAGTQWVFAGDIEIGGRTSVIAIVAGLAAMAGGAAALLYYALCYLLLWAGRAIPWRLPSVLDEAVRLGLMIRVAGSYAFLHKLQRDYYANLQRAPMER